MTKFFKFAALAAITAMWTSCTEIPLTPDDDTDTPETPKVEITEDLKFTLEVSEVETDLAKIEVSHNGTTKDTWYGFETTATNITVAIQEKVNELTAEDGKIKDLKKNTKTTVTVEGLESETDYTYIVFAVTEDGTVYGTPASVKFTTEKEEVVPPTPEGMAINPNWTVTYSGAQEYEGTVYEHTATVTSTDENAWFLSSAWKKAEFEAALETYGIDAIAQAELEDFKDYVELINEYYGTNFTAADLAYVGTEWDAISVSGGEWIVMAIGIGADSELSMLYAVSEPFTITEEEATSAYAAWIGDWTFTGANGASYNVTLEKKINNETYNLYGWDGNDLDDYPVEVTWIADYGLWTIYPQDFGTFSFTDGSEGNIYFLGGQKAGNSYDLYTDVPTCMGYVAEDGSYNVVGYADEENGVDMTLMCHFVVFDGAPYFWNDPAAVPTFPITVTPAEAPASTRSAEKNFNSARKHFTKQMKIKSFTPEFKAL